MYNYIFDTVDFFYLYSAICILVTFVLVNAVFLVYVAMHPSTGVSQCHRKTLQADFGISSH